jgi:hypothetical protein
LVNPAAVSESEQPQPTPAADAQPFTPLDIGMLVVLVAMAVAGAAGLIAVLTEDNDLSALGAGFGVVWSIVVSGATMACALATLSRRRLVALSLCALVAAGLAVDLLVLAIWLDIDSQTYGKLVGIALVGALFGLVILGLTLACRPRDAIASWLYFATVSASLLAVAIAWILILTTGDEDFTPSAFGSVVPFDAASNLLRPLAAVAVVVAALWFAALAASRVERTTEG